MSQAFGALCSAGDTIFRTPPGTIAQPCHLDSAHCFAGRTSLQPQALSATGSRSDCAVLVIVSVLYCSKLDRCCLQERKHSSTWRLVPGDASSRETWQSVASLLPRPHSLSGQHIFVLMLEVLDNLPHDRWVLGVEGVRGR